MKRLIPTARIGFPRVPRAPRGPRASRAPGLKQKPAKGRDPKSRNFGLKQKPAKGRDPKIKKSDRRTF